MDSPKFPVREHGPREGLVSSLKYYSKTRIDKNSRRAPSVVGKTYQQKRHPVRSALKNGGAGMFDGIAALKPVCPIPCLSGKEQEILPILGLFGGFWRYPIIKCFVGRNEEENSKFPKVINREKTRICREKLLNGRENTIYSRD